MRWSKIKTIMICFLLAMNMFLIGFNVITSQKETKVPEDVITASVKVLYRDGFYCSKEIIPEFTYELPVLKASFYSASDLSEMFFDKQLAFRTTGGSLVAGEEDKSLTVSGDYFAFKSSKKADLSHSPEKIKRALKKVGISMDGAVYDEKERCFYMMYKGINLFNMYIKAELDSDGKICEITALWPGKLVVHEKKTLSFVSDVTKLKNTFPNGGKINLIEKGYSLVPLGNENYLFSPAWRVRIGEELKIIE